MINCEYILNQVESKRNSLISKIEQDKFNNECLLNENEEYSNVSYKLKATIFDLQRAKYLHNKEQVAILEKQKAQIECEKAQLFDKLALNLPKISYNCEICKDKGFIDDNICHCHFNYISEAIYDFLEVSPTNLSCFEQDTLSSVNNQQTLFDKVKGYANNFSLQSKNLVFSGSPGLGKTFLAMAVASEVSKKDFVVLYLTAFDFNQILLKYHLAKGYEKIIYYEILTTCDLLVIDDLGVEPIYKNVTTEHTLSIISQRLNLSKPFIITTNLSFDNLFERYGERLFSRLKGKNVAKIEFKGKDLR